MLNWPGSNREQITCNTRNAYHIHVVCHGARRDSSAIKFGTVEIAYILALFCLAEPLINEGREETGVQGENS